MKTVNQIIRDPTPENAQQMWSSIIPDEVKSYIPSIFERLDAGESSEQVAENTVVDIIDIVETVVLEEGVNRVFESGISDRIIDLMTGQTMLNVFERVAEALIGTI